MDLSPREESMAQGRLVVRPRRPQPPGGGTRRCPRTAGPQPPASRPPAGRWGHPSPGEEGRPRAHPGLHPLQAAAEAGTRCAPLRLWEACPPQDHSGPPPPPLPRRRWDPSSPSPPAPLQVSERRLRPLPQKQRTLHEKILEEIKQERRLRPVEGRHRDGRGERGTAPPAPGFPPPPLTAPSEPASPPSSPGFGSLPCILNACSGDVKSTSCINLSVTDAGSSAQRPRPRVLLKAPTLAEMEEMTTSEVRARRFRKETREEVPGLSPARLQRPTVGAPPAMKLASRCGAGSARQRG